MTYDMLRRWFTAYHLGLVSRDILVIAIDIWQQSMPGRIA